MIRHLHPFISSFTEDHELIDAEVGAQPNEDISDFEIEHSDVINALENLSFEPSNDVIDFIMKNIKS